MRQVCAKVLPSVMPCLIDPGSLAVREAAFSCVETYLGKLKEVSARMQVEEEERRKAEVKYDGYAVLLLVVGLIVIFFLQ